MSYHPTYSYPPQRQILLQEITKSFKQVTHICQNYLQTNIKPSVLTEQTHQPTQHINFNNYKAHIDLKVNNSQKISTFDVDAQSSLQQPAINLQKGESKSKNSIKLIKPQLKPSVPLTKKIPPPPKAPLSPYFIFYNDKKDVIKGEFPEMSVTEITAAASKVWKNLTEQEKEPFNRKFFEEKEKYDKLMKEYVRKYPNYKEIYRKVLPTASNNEKK